ncbi:hypothetical protein [Actinocrispum wychmicini]|uniref:Uncharacterized protein n=1 Tax=Actinocrispum wychmicini TaxID=1213861 RepID=A0A4R2JKS1_9PSEU|nr:hypothetical protein [Actinocrispum wychmicini]TCO60601.1 hypothetical protein EV192_103176 [Actinocrispum wychmicini]
MSTRFEDTTRGRLLLFGAVLAFVFVVSWMFGNAFAPANTPTNPRPATTGRQHPGGH